MISILLYVVSKVWLFLPTCCADSGYKGRPLWDHPPLLLPPKPYRRSVYPKKCWPSGDVGGDNGSSTEEEEEGRFRTRRSPSLFRQNDDFSPAEELKSKESTFVEVMLIGDTAGGLYTCALLSVPWLVIY